MASWQDPFYLGTDFYDVLGVKWDDTPDDIKKKYRKLVRELHPDAVIGESKSIDPADRRLVEDVFKEVQEAYRVLGDSALRGQYGLMGSGIPSGPAGDAERARIHAEREEKKRLRDEALVRIQAAKDRELAEAEKLEETRRLNQEAVDARRAANEALLNMLNFQAPEGASEDEIRAARAAHDENSSRLRQEADRLESEARQAQDAENARLRAQREEEETRRRAEGRDEHGRPRAQEARARAGGGGGGEDPEAARRQRAAEEEARRRAAEEAAAEEARRRAAEEAAERERIRRRDYPTREEQEEDLFAALRQHREGQTNRESELNDAVVEGNLRRERPTQRSEDEVLEDIHVARENKQGQDAEAEARLQGYLGDEASMHYWRTNRDREEARRKEEETRRNEEHAQLLEEEAARPMTPEERLMRWARRRWPRNAKVEAQEAEQPGQREQENVSNGSSENRG